MAYREIQAREFSINGLIAFEAEEFENKDDNFSYKQIVSAFGVQPRGCSADRYLIARAAAANVWQQWADSEIRLLPDDTTAHALLKAATIYEVTNYLISANLESWFIGLADMDDGLFNLPSPLKREEVIELYAAQIESSEALLSAPNLSFSYREQLREYLTYAESVFKGAQAYKVLVHDGEQFTEREIGQRGRIDEHVKDQLLCNLVMLIARIGDNTSSSINQARALEMVNKFANDFVNPVSKQTDDKISPQAFSKRYHRGRKNKDFETLLDQTLVKFLGRYGL